MSEYYCSVCNTKLEKEEHKDVFVLYCPECECYVDASNMDIYFEEIKEAD